MRIKKILTVFIFILALPFFVLAAPNDPGHDTLYIEQIGNSSLTGQLNISDELRITGLTQPGGLILYGEGTIPGTDVSFISTNAGSVPMYIGAAGNLYLKYKGGDQVQIGVPTGVTDLNVTGVIYEQNVRVCLANGTNCIGGNNSGNVSSVVAGNGISVSGTTGDVTVSANATTCVAGNYSYWDGDSWECAPDQNSGSDGTVTGTGSNTRLAYWNASNSITSTAGFTFDGTDLTLPGDINMPTAFYIGSGATSSSTNTIAIGTNANAGNTESIAIGLNANAANSYNTAIGSGTYGYSRSVALGYLARSESSYAVALGYQTNATGDSAIAIGNDAKTIHTGDIAIGSGAYTDSTSGIAIGTGANATDFQAIAIGFVAKANDSYAIAIGRAAHAQQYSSMALGYNTDSAHQYSVALGDGATTTANNQLMVGTSTQNLNTYIHGTLEVNGGTQGITLDSTSTSPTIDTTAGNLTITSATGYVIIDLG